MYATMNASDENQMNAQVVRSLATSKSRLPSSDSLENDNYKLQIFVLALTRSGIIHCK